MVKHIDPSYSQKAYIRKLIMTTANATKSPIYNLVTSGSNPIPYLGTGTFDLPEGTYYLKYLIYTSDIEAYPHGSANNGLVVRIKQGYTTYLELSGYGEIPYAEIRRTSDGIKIGVDEAKGSVTLIHGGSAAGTYTANFFAAQYSGANHKYFDHELSGAYRISWKIGTAAGTLPTFTYQFATGIAKGAQNTLTDVNAGVYWVRGRRAANAWYGWDTARWQPLFVFPGTEANTLRYEYAKGVRNVTYND
jgi:hypothetical protein